ncbi:hypothetical protein G5B47_02175 [Paenibacillus sp. 7124]|uniref:Uncharacterized protein n=1 Tax=Paenibacillus apii TaxID=1850370 RepID=A0A6M1PF62_9BACL|nr:hypothetical protein [Paenibacillus apii]NGM81214.1 hypothetical protein [Paenibacillus apii]
MTNVIDTKPDVTYREALAAAVAEMETLMRTLFKAEGEPPIMFDYGDWGYDLRDRHSRRLAVKAVSDVYTLAHNDFNAENQRRYFDRGGNGEGPALISADTALLDRLADVLLYEEITDENPYKIAHTEYPFMSDRQLDLRRDRETSDSAAESHAVDGNDYRAPEKRRRTPYENYRVDTGAKIRNAERAAQYKRDTAPGKEVTYNLRDTGGELAPEFVNCRGIGQRWRDDMSAVNEVTVEPAEDDVREAA